MTVRQALAALGDTPAKVAATLRAAGIKGHRGSSGCCPVARHLRANGFAWARVGRHTANVQGQHYGLPGAVEDFALAFDHGCYPDLEAT